MPRTNAILCQMYQAYLDKSTPFTTYRWAGTGVLFLFFMLRIFLAQGWYIGQSSQALQPACGSLLTRTQSPTP